MLTRVEAIFNTNKMGQCFAAETEATGKEVKTITKQLNLSKNSIKSHIPKSLKQPK